MPSLSPDLLPLETICDVIDPHPSHRAPKAVTENAIPFVGIGDFDANGKILPEQARMVSADIYAQHKDRYSLTDDLLVLGRVASIGKVVRLPKTGTLNRPGLVGG